MSEEVYGIAWRESQLMDELAEIEELLEDGVITEQVAQELAEDIHIRLILLNDYGG